MRLHFQIRHENGYNLAINKQYNRWLRLTRGFTLCSGGQPLVFLATRVILHLKKPSLYYITRKDPAGHNVVNKSRDDRNTGLSF